MKLKTLAKILLVPALFALAACGGGGSSSGEGKLTLRLADAPVDGVTNVWIKFDSIEVKPAGDGPSITFDLSSTAAVDLVTLQNGVRATLLDEVTLPAGQYNWIRLHVNLLNDSDPVPADFTVANVCYVEAGGEDFPLYIPSGDQTGLKLNRGFIVPVGGETDFTLDFDLRRSLRFGNDETYKLKPVIRIADNTVVGSIAGDVLNIPVDKNCEDGAVYVFTGPSASPMDIRDAATDPLTVAKPVLDPETGCGYRVLWVEPGTYTLAFTWDALNDDPDANDTLAFTGTGDAVVVADTEVIFDFDLGDL